MFRFRFGNFALTLACVAAGSVPALAQNHPWAMRYSNPQRTGQTLATGPTFGELVWKYRTAGNVPQFAASSAGEIIMGVTYNQNTWSEEEYLASLNADGTISSRKKMVPYVWGASQGVSSSPAIDAQGNLIVPSPNSQLVKLTADFAPIWTYQEQANTLNDSSPAVLADGSIRHIQGSKLRALDSAGNVLWTSNGGGRSGSVAVSPNGDMAACSNRGDQSQLLVTLWYWAADGTLKWTLSTRGGGNGSTPCFGPDGTLYGTIPGFGTGALNPDGTTKWVDTVHTGGLAQGLGKNGQFYSAAIDKLRAFNKDTGALLWESTLPGSIVEGLAIDSSDTIFATTANGYIVAVGANGSIKWSTKVCETFKTGPIVGPNNLCVAAGMDGFERFVYAIK